MFEGPKFLVQWHNMIQYNSSNTILRLMESGTTRNYFLVLHEKGQYKALHHSKFEMFYRLTSSAKHLVIRLLVQWYVLHCIKWWSLWKKKNIRWSKN